MTEKEYLSVPELARILGLSRIAVYKKVKSGKIPSIRIGRNYAIPKTVIREITGGQLSDRQKETIKAAVKKTVGDYGDVLKRLGQE